MGYAPSGHHFNRVIQKAMEGIERVHIEVDDLLIEGRTEKEAIQTFHEVLQRCRDYKIKLARFKLQVGEEVTLSLIHI